MRGYKNFDSDPHPGDLRHMIEIGYTENQINENGYPEPTDVVVCRVWAAVTDAGNPVTALPFLADSEATTVAGLREDYNRLLAALRTAGLMAQEAGDP